MAGVWQGCGRGVAGAAGRYQDAGHRGLQQRQHGRDDGDAAAPERGAEDEAAREADRAHVAAGGLRVLLALVVHVQEEEEEQEADEQVGVGRIDDEERRDGGEEQLHPRWGRAQARESQGGGGLLVSRRVGLVC